MGLTDICENSENKTTGEVFQEKLIREKPIDVFDAVYVGDVTRSNVKTEIKCTNLLNDSVSHHEGYHLKDIIPLENSFKEYGRTDISPNIFTGYLVLHYVKDDPESVEKCIDLDEMDACMDIISGKDDGSLTNALNLSLLKHKGFRLIGLEPMGETRLVIYYEKTDAYVPKKTVETVEEMKDEELAKEDGICYWNINGDGEARFESKQGETDCGYEFDLLYDKLSENEDGKTVCPYCKRIMQILR